MHWRMCHLNQPVSSEPMESVCVLSESANESLLDQLMSHLNQRNKIVSSASITLKTLHEYLIQANMSVSSSDRNYNYTRFLHNQSPAAVFTDSILVHEDLTWKIFINDHKLSEALFPFIPHLLEASAPAKKMNEAQVCPGNLDSNFQVVVRPTMRKLMFSSKVHIETFPLTVNGNRWSDKM